MQRPFPHSNWLASHSVFVPTDTAEQWQAFQWSQYSFFLCCSLGQMLFFIFPFSPNTCGIKTVSTSCKWENVQKESKYGTQAGFLCVPYELEPNNYQLIFSTWWMTIDIKLWFNSSLYFSMAYLDRHTNIQHLHFKGADIQIKYDQACPQRHSAAFHCTSAWQQYGKSGRFMTIRKKKRACRFGHVCTERD